jgi:hypothetical protein
VEIADLKKPEDIHGPLRSGVDFSYIFCGEFREKFWPQKCRGKLKVLKIVFPSSSAKSDFPREIILSIIVI